METTTAPAAFPYLVVIDPTNARSIVAEYATYTEAQARVDREVASRLNGRGGSIYIYHAGEAVTIYRVNPDTYAGQCHKGFGTDSLMTADAPFVCGRCGGDRRKAAR